MKTITIQIGNSDDKLTQKEWSSFVLHCRDLINASPVEIHFFGASTGYATWQNAAWVLSLTEDNVAALKADFTEIRKLYRQDSVAFTEGETQFI